VSTTSGRPGWIIAASQNGRKCDAVRAVVPILIAIGEAGCAATDVGSDGTEVVLCGDETAALENAGEVVDGTTDGQADDGEDDEEPKDCGKHGGDEHLTRPPGQAKK
jgi:hypothetical protein